MRILQASLASLILTGSFGCGEDEPARHVRSHDAAIEDASAALENVSKCGASIPDRPTAIESTGEQSGMILKVVSADFAPPRRYANRWTIALTDGAGRPVSKASFSDVRTWMDVEGHKHDGNFTPTISEQTESPGTYVFENVYFTMTGAWQLQLKVVAGAITESFALDICVGD